MNLKLKTSLVALLLITLFSCEKNNEIDTPNNNADFTEYSRIQILVNDKTTNVISVISAADDKIKNLDGGFAASNMYTSASKRYVVIANHENNSVKIYDSGIEEHNDHSHVLKFSGLIPVTGKFEKPVHTFLKYGAFSIFNDASGEISYLDERKITQNEAKFSTIKPANTSAHHGGIVRFKDGKFAVTARSTTVSSGSTLPEIVNVVDSTGRIIHAGTVATTGLHGDDSDGEYAVFGSYSGILVIKNTGEQFLIPNPSNFGERDILGTVFYSSHAKKFYGSSGSKGIFEINIKDKKITPVVESNTIYQSTFDYSTKNIVVLSYNGKVSFYDTQSNKLVKEEKLVEPFASADKKAYAIKATEKFLYFISGDKNELKKIAIKDFSKTTSYPVSANPNKLAIVGLEMDK